MLVVILVSDFFFFFFVLCWSFEILSWQCLFCSCPLVEQLSTDANYAVADFAQHKTVESIAASSCFGCGLSGIKLSAGVEAKQRAQITHMVEHECIVIENNVHCLAKKKKKKVLVFKQQTSIYLTINEWKGSRLFSCTCMHRVHLGSTRSLFWGCLKWNPEVHLPDDTASRSKTVFENHDYGSGLFFAFCF